MSAFMDSCQVDCVYLDFVVYWLSHSFRAMVRRAYWFLLKLVWKHLSRFLIKDRELVHNGKVAQEFSQRPFKCSLQFAKALFPVFQNFPKVPIPGSPSVLSLYEQCRWGSVQLRYRTLSTLLFITHFEALTTFFYCAKYFYDEYEWRWV